MPDCCDNPRDEDKAIAVAWCFVLGCTQAEASRRTEVPEPTISRWRNSEWWPEKMAEARKLVPSHFAAKALNALDKGLDENDQTTARYVADRVVEEMAPPALRAELGGTLDINITKDDVDTARASVIQALKNKQTPSGE